MPFWGVEVKPRNPYTHVHDLSQGKLRITQATLGLGTGYRKNFVQCNVGSKSPVRLCSLFPDRTESCSLDLEFKEDDEVVFSVTGPRSVHLSGYYTTSGDYGNGDELDSIGEDIEESENDESGSYDSDDKYEEDFIDDDELEMLPPSPRPNSEAVIEEILDEEVPANGAINRKSRKKLQVIESDNDNLHSECQIIAKQKQFRDFESEDEDGFPLSLSFFDNSCAKILKRDAKSNEILDKNKTGKDETATYSRLESGNVQGSLISSVEIDTKSEKKKRERTQAEDDKLDDSENLADSYEVDESQKSGNSDKKKRKKKKNKKGEFVESVVDMSGEKDIGEGYDRNPPYEKKDAAYIDSATNIEGGCPKKKKNKKKSRKSQVSQDGETCNGIEEGDGNKFQNEGDRDHSISQPEKKQKNTTSFNSTVEKEPDLIESVKHLKGQEVNFKPLQSRTFSNGLMIEELAMGEPEGKRASNGKKVSVHYIGKLQNGDIIDSNIGQQPFRFRLGVGQVIKGWDVGVNGMRIGDKRRLTVPPSMGYGSKEKGMIPANSRLIYEVELVDVK